MEHGREHRGAVDVEHAARGEWLSWSRMADFEDAEPPVYVGGEGPYISDSNGAATSTRVSGLFTTQVGYSFGKEFATAAADAARAARLLSELGGDESRRRSR